MHELLRKRFVWGCLFIVFISRTESMHPQAVGVRAEIHLPFSQHTRSSESTLPPAVLWLNPVPTRPMPRIATGNEYTLLQKDKMFLPHLMIVPVGSVVHFPNHDPYFHNVFSLFEGKRFDLGLYEAGKTKDVLFSREGVSYIFCNIHSEMSAVVIALATPLFSVADRNGLFFLPNVPQGDYEMHLWVEGQSKATLSKWVKPVHISQPGEDLGKFALDSTPASPHKNKFGATYGSASTPSY